MDGFHVIGITLLDVLTYDVAIVAHKPYPTPEVFLSAASGSPCSPQNHTLYKSTQWIENERQQTLLGRIPAP